MGKTTVLERKSLIKTHEAILATRKNAIKNCPQQFMCAYIPKMFNSCLKYIFRFGFKLTTNSDLLILGMRLEPVSSYFDYDS